MRIVTARRRPWVNVSAPTFQANPCSVDARRSVGLSGCDWRREAPDRLSNEAHSSLKKPRSSNQAGGACSHSVDACPDGRTQPTGVIRSSLSQLTGEPCTAVRSVPSGPGSN